MCEIMRSSGHGFHTTLYWASMGAFLKCEDRPVMERGVISIESHIKPVRRHNPTAYIGTDNLGMRAGTTIARFKSQVLQLSQNFDRSIYTPFKRPGLSQNMQDELAQAENHLYGFPDQISELIVCLHCRLSPDKCLSMGAVRVRYRHSVPVHVVDNLFDEMIQTRLCYN